MNLQYYHVFFVKIAVDLKEMSRGHVASKPKYHVNNIIQFWFKFGRKFLYEQTIERRFEVRLIYSPLYEDLIFSYDYPDFVKFYLYHPNPKEQPWRNLDDVPRPCLVHRLDADDQYSRDFFMYSEQRANSIYQPYHDAMLHTRYLQFDVRARLTSPPLNITAPHFITVRLLEGQSLPRDKDPLHTKQHNVPRLFNTVPSGPVALALECLHGRNLVNRWFGGNRGTLVANRRFVYFGERVTDPTAIGPEPLKSSNK